MLLHLHGGWFHAGSATAYRHLVAQIAARANAQAFVPNYRLASAHDAVQLIWPIEPLSLPGALRATWLNLWDEANGRMVSFRDAVARPLP